MYDELKDFGLSDTEISIYTTLLKTGSSTANRTAKITGIKRTTTYDNLALLMNKGIVSTVMKGKVNFYIAADPQKIIRLLEDRRERIKKIIPELQTLKGTVRETTGVTFFEGKKGVITVLNDIIDEKKELWFYGSRKKALHALQHYPENFIQKRAEHGIPLRAVLAEEDRGDPAYNDKKIYALSSLKFLKKLNNMTTNVFMYGDKVAFMTSGENLVGIIVKNEDVVKQQREIFNILWSIAS
ncbi:MAG: helix-turn-helix domain-containing protein [archaeon]